MLEQLQVKNLALTSEALIEFKDRMSAITGETGAGKSLIVDALSLVLGARADVTMIKDGQSKLEVEAVFSKEEGETLEYLKQLELIDSDDQNIIIRRIISADGKSKAQINAHTVNLSQLKDVGSHLVSIHGQHASIKIIDETNQLSLLDAFASLLDKRQALADAFNEYNYQRNELTKLATLQKDLAAMFKTLRHQQDVLRELNLKEGDYEKLEQSFDQAMNQNKIYDAKASALECLSNEDKNIIDILNSKLDALTKALQYDKELTKAIEPMKSAIALLNDVKENLDALVESHNIIDPVALEQKMSKCHELARIFKIAPKDLYLKKDEIDTKIENFLALKDKIEEKTQKVKVLRESYEVLAKQLSDERIKHAKTMSKSVTELIHTLAMKDGEFKVLVEYDESIRPRVSGRDNVKFLFSANIGQELKDIGAVASGGELSRLALAIEAITSKNNKTPTIIFDEVDTGISGITASSVGKLLHDLGSHVQVLTVTHLPQVAAYANNHYLVSKTVRQGKTSSKIELLTQEGRVNELARMMGGNVITASTLQSASDLLEKTLGHV